MQHPSAGGGWAPPPQTVPGVAPPGWAQPAAPQPQQPAYYAPPPQHGAYGGDALHRRVGGGIDSTNEAGMEGGTAFSPESLARMGFSAYGEKMLGAGHSFVQSNYAKYLSGNEMRYYFTVNSRYVRNKLKVLLCPFTLKGHWNRALEQGGAKFKPPASDINAPDLYIPLMGFLTYCLLCCVADVLSVPNRFKPERLGRFAWWGCLAWGGEVLLLWAGLKSLATSQTPIHVPLLDLTAYAGYTFVLVSAECAVGLVSRAGYYALLLWGGLCTAVFLVKTMKRILYAETRSHYGVDPQRHNYLLLALALLQLPFAFALGYLPDYRGAASPAASAAAKE